ncbi:MAG: Rid family hydrolase [Thermoanaerobaculia bacterium]|nr:Rid family hydrolase [Thermoanaerobaculia bacterium]
MAGTPLGSTGHRLPFSAGMKAGDTIYVSGTVAVDGQGQVVGVGDVEAQTRFVLDAIREVLADGGATLADVVFNQVFLRDLDDFRGMNRVYREYFPENPPARYTVQSPLVLDELRVEIASIAYVGD